ncbi:MAG: erythromycin esterase family protein [Planctomycetota bacterium]|nr:erythromycin esterase family protein [Planctomycetota bacterium]
MRTAWAASWLTGIAAFAGGGVVSLAQPADDATAWVRTHAREVRTVHAGADLADLSFLKDMIGDARIVGLGESTHGSREQFQFKHRVLEYLATEMGFTVFSIEASAPESFAVDEYVSKGEGDPEVLVGGMLFWTWNTEEVAAMVRWMRAFNEREGAVGSGKRVRFTGFDMQSPGLPLKILRDALGPDDPLAGELESLRRTVRAIGEGPMGGVSPFAVSTGTFPAKQAAGKSVTLSGWIRTEDVRGRVGLWWRADKADGSVGAFDNMLDRGPTGTTAWQRFALTLDNPPDTTNVNFGAIMTGKGRAWIDDLRIELDGVEWKGPGFDLSFGAPAMEGFSSGQTRTYETAFDAGVGHDAPGSLRLASTAVEPDGVTPEEALAAAARFVASLRLADERFAGRGMSPAQRAWLGFNANLLRQWAMMYAEANGYAARDRAMAENVRWILQGDPDAKIVLWAHNAHVSAMQPNMGWHLREWYGKDYVSVGFGTARGTYAAIRRGEGLHAGNPLEAPPERSIESVLDAAAPPIAILDIRPARGETEFATAWLRERRPFRFVGAIATEQQFGDLPAAEAFDLLAWVRETSSAVQLKGRRSPGVEP